jgi:hypothetical protein
MLNGHRAQLSLSETMVARSRALLDAARRDRAAVKAEVEAGLNAIAASKTLLNRIGRVRGNRDVARQLEVGAKFLRIQGVFLHRLATLDEAPSDRALDRFRRRACEMQ